MRFFMSFLSISSVASAAVPRTVPLRDNIPSPLSHNAECTVPQPFAQNLGSTFSTKLFQRTPPSNTQASEENTNLSELPGDGYAPNGDYVDWRDGGNSTMGSGATTGRNFPGSMQGTSIVMVGVAVGVGIAVGL